MQLVPLTVIKSSTHLLEAMFTGLGVMDSLFELRNNVSPEKECENSTEVASLIRSSSPSLVVLNLYPNK